VANARSAAEHWRDQAIANLANLSSKAKAHSEDVVRLGRAIDRLHEEVRLASAELDLCVEPARVRERLRRALAPTGIPIGVDGLRAAASAVSTTPAR
jgi:intracellular sulfur oxidation DsrE/DsrF family protein